MDKMKILGFAILSFFVIVAVCGFVSPSMSDKLLIAVSLFGVLWLFFGTSFFIKKETEAASFVTFLFLTLLVLLFWIILKGTGLDTAISSTANANSANNLLNSFNLP